MPGGRPRKPTDLKVLQGTARPDRLNLDEPAPVAGEPACPAWLDAVAREEWEDTARLLREMGLLSLDVAPVLTAYCQAYADWRRCCDKLKARRMSMLTMTRWAMMRDRSLGHMLRHLTEMGLTPASRSKVTSQGKSRSKLREFLGGSGS